MQRREFPERKRKEPEREAESTERYLKQLEARSQRLREGTQRKMREMLASIDQEEQRREYARLDQEVSHHFISY